MATDTDDANPPELPDSNGWHVVVNGKCVYCGGEFDTQMVADSPDAPNCDAAEWEQANAHPSYWRNGYNTDYGGAFPAE